MVKKISTYAIAEPQFKKNEYFGIYVRVLRRFEMSESFIGEIRMVGFNRVPAGWAPCDGQLLSISDYTALFSLLGTAFGGDGRSTFGLPDLRGAVPVGYGTAPDRSPRRLGERGGAENLSLRVANLPSHNHTLAANPQGGNSISPVGNIPATSSEGDSIYRNIGNTPPNEYMNSQSIGSTGGGQPVSHMPPFQVVSYIICTTDGVYPTFS